MYVCVFFVFLVNASQCKNDAGFCSDSTPAMLESCGSAKYQPARDDKTNEHAFLLATMKRHLPRKNVGLCAEFTPHFSVIARTEGHCLVPELR